MTLQVDPATVLAAPRFLDAGEAALVVQFGDRVDPAINDRVLALDAVLRADPPLGTREFVPTYRSLMIHYDPLLIDRDTLVAIVRRATAAVAEGRLSPKGGERPRPGHCPVATIRHWPRISTKRLRF
jgi:inhibitor of KinA